MKCTEKYWNGYHQMTTRRLMKDILGKDLERLVNGCWVILDLKIGEMRHSLACFGVMELVSYGNIYTCIYSHTNLYIVAGSGKTVLAYGYSKTHHYYELANIQ